MKNSLDNVNSSPGEYYCGNYTVTQSVRSYIISIYTRTSKSKNKRVNKSLQFIRSSTADGMSRTHPTDGGGGVVLANSSSDLVLVAARAELLVSDRKSDVPFLHRHTVRVESDDNRPGRVRCNAKTSIINSFNVDFPTLCIDSPSISRAVSQRFQILSFSVFSLFGGTFAAYAFSRRFSAPLLHGVCSV